MGSLLRDLMGPKRQTKLVTDDWCPGDEGSPKGRNKGDPCDNHFHIEIEVTYKETEQK